MGVEVTGVDLSPVPHDHGGGKGLAPWRGAGVQHLAPRGEPRGQHGQSGGGVLGIKHPLAPALALGQVPGGGEGQAVGQPGVGGHRHPLPLEQLHHLRGLEAAGIHLDGDGGLTVVPPEEGLQLLPVQAVPPILHQPLGVAVEQGEVGGGMGPVQRRQVVQMPGQVAEDAVDHPAGPGILTQLLGEGHGLAHRGAHGNFGEEEHLVQPQPEAVAHLALHLGQFHGGVLLEVVVQQHPVLQHSKAQAGGQGSVPPVQMGLLDDFFQMAVGPGLLMVHGNQSLQGSFPGRHALVPSFLSLGGFIR